MGVVAHAPNALEHSYRVRSADGGPEESFHHADLEEQLGLRLESAKGPVEVLVTDRAERLSKS